MSTRIVSLALIGLCGANCVDTADAAAIPDEDQRIGEPRTLKTRWAFPRVENANAWKNHAIEIRNQALVSCGLWPMPKKTPLQARVFDRIDRGDYSVEKVHIQTLPGWFLCGNLFRPRNQGNGPFPGVLSPHGHWGEGRLVDEERGSVSARCINFAKQGMIAFAYDMFGYNDTSQAGPHREFATSLDNQLWGINLMGLQTWNSIRALDFLESTPEVDRSRLACTGGSGGGTQTFMLGAVDRRLAVQAPCVMVSHSMQGGCLCENAPGLRVRFSNMEIAASVAPRPQILVAATGDWTKTTMEIEGPGIRSAYHLLSADQHLHYVLHDYEHNYNKATRESVYSWLGKWLLPHLKPGQLTERPYTKEPDKGLLVFPDKQFPADAITKEQLIDMLKTRTRQQLIALQPINTASLKNFQKIMRPAWRSTLQLESGVTKTLVETLGTTQRGNHMITRLVVGTEGRGNRVPVIQFKPMSEVKTWVIVVHPEGKGVLLAEDGSPTGLVAALLENGMGVIAPDLFLTGELSNPALVAKRKLTVNFFTTYNRTDLQERVGDLRTLAGYAKKLGDKLLVAGVGRAGLWVLPAAPLADGVIADCDQLNPTDEELIASDLFLPGYHRLGNFQGMALVAGANPLLLHNTGGQFAADWLAKAYASSKSKGRLTVSQIALNDSDLAQWAMSIDKK